ncbi:MAG TPA: flagellar biosynthetic protein FliR [Rhodanobacter sp.]
MHAITGFICLFVLITLRYLPVFVLPGFTPLGWAPVLVRTIVLLAMAWMTVMALPARFVAAEPLHDVGLVVAAIGELLIGMVFGLAVMLPNAAMHTAGWLADMQAGLGAAVLFDPAAGASESMLGRALMLATTVLFFILGLHVALLRMLLRSVEVLPPGSVAVHPDGEAFLLMVGSSFASGLMLVAPLALGMFCLDVAVGYATRSMPQANIYFLVMPLKIVVALLLLASTLAYMPALIGRLFNHAFEQVGAIMGAG